MENTFPKLVFIVASSLVPRAPELISVCLLLLNLHCQSARRKLGFFTCKKVHLSLFLEGAEQAVFGFPRCFEKCKLSQFISAFLYIQKSRSPPGGWHHQGAVRKMKISQGKALKEMERQPDLLWQSLPSCKGAPLLSPPSKSRFPQLDIF